MLRAVRAAAGSDLIARLVAPLDSQSSGMRVLVLAANPLGTSRLDLEAEVTGIEEGLLSALNRDRITLACKLAVTPDDMIRHVRRLSPNVLHFSGHGSRDGIHLGMGGSAAIEVSGDALARFVAGRGLRLVVLSSCHAWNQMERLADVVEVVVGTTHVLEDAAALRFSRAFYRALGDGLSVREALRDGKDAARLYGLGDVFAGVGDLDISFS
jgi:hypothetical protein